MVCFSEHIILLLWHYGKVILTSIDDVRGSDTWKFDERGKFTERKKKHTVEYEKKENDILPFTLLNKIVLIVFNRTGKNCEETSLMSEKTFEIIFTKCCQVNVNGNVDNQIVK